MLLAGVSAPAAGAQSQRVLPAAATTKVEQAISAEMSRQNIPGISVEIVTDGEPRWSNDYGLADLENFVPAKAATACRIELTRPP